MERKLVYTVPQEADGIRLERFLMGMHGFSRRIVRTLKQRPDDILRNGSHIRMIDPVFFGDVITAILRDIKETAAPSAVRVPVLYDDDDLVIYNKPPFLAMHPAKRHQSDTLANVYAASHPESTFRPVYRLDRDTDGICVCAKNALAASRLAGRVEKTYTAVVSGGLPEDCGAIHAPIVQLQAHQMRRGVRADGQRALTMYTVLKRTPSCTLLSLTLPTGRTHQIRVHLAHIGCPLVGDTMYGVQNRGVKRQALSCTAVRFIHPATEKTVDLCINMHQDLELLVQNE